MFRPFRPLPSLALATLIAGLLGCSGNGGPTTTPDLASTTPSELPESPIAAALLEGGLPLFVAEGALDFSTGEISLEHLSLRQAQANPVANDIRVLDVSPFLTDSPCVDCFRVTGLGLDPQGNIIADFAMRHPFPTTEKRKDLDVFDPIAIFITGGSTSFPGLDRVDENGNGSGDDRPTMNPYFVANADGYTSRHDFLVSQLFPNRPFPGNINPYVSFFTEDNPSATGIGSPIPFHRFGMTPTVDNKRVTFLRPRTPDGTGQYNFLVVVSVGYGQSATFANTVQDPDALGSRQNPVYMNPEFNMKEPYSVQTTVANALEAGNPASSTLVTAFIKDWQAAASVDPGYPGFPDYVNRQGLKWRSNLAEVKMQVPGITNTLFTANRDQRAGGNGSNASPYRFDFTVTNTLSAGPGEYVGLVAAVDEYQADGRMLPGYAPSESYRHWTTYQAVKITVAEPACPTPTAVAGANPTTADSGEEITFTSNLSAGNGASLVQYEWDFDGQDPPEWTGPNPDPVQWAYTNPTSSNVVETATLTVRTDCGTAHSATVQVTIRGNQPPVGSFTMAPNPVNPGVTVNLDGSASSDPDPGDTIDSYEWDFDYTAPNFDVDATGAATSTQYTNAGPGPRTVTVALRVTDNRGASSIATQTLTVNPPPACVLPTARAGSSTTSAVSGQPITFFANLSTPNGTQPFTKYTWDWDLFDPEPAEVFFPDGDGNLPAVDHTYLYTGGGTRQFRARLTVYTSDTCFNATQSGGGCDADFRCDIVVTITSNTPPVAVCGASPNPVVAGVPVQFSETGSFDPDPTGSIVKYQWDWDDRNGINWATPDYESTTQGGAVRIYANTSGVDETFNATLRVIDNLGTATTCTVPMTVKPNNAPTAVAAANPNPVPYSGQATRLIDSGSSDPDPGDTLTYIWDFDASNGVDLNPATADSVSTTPDTPLVTYTNNGTSPIEITATLRVRDQGGLTDDASVIITVNPPPSPPIITFAEAAASAVPGATYIYRQFSQTPKKDWSFIVDKVNNGGPWDFTDTTTWPVSQVQKIRRFDLPSAIPCVNFGPQCTIIYQTLDLNQYEGRSYTGGEAKYYGVDDCGGTQLIYDTPLVIPYPETVGTPWNLFTTADFMGFEMNVNVIVGRQQYGFTKTYAGEFLALVEEAIQTLSIPDLGITLSQEEKTWVSDEGYLIADWLQELNSTSGDPTGKATGIVLNSYTIP